MARQTRNRCLRGTEAGRPPGRKGGQTPVLLLPQLSNTSGLMKAAICDRKSPPRIARKNVADRCAFTTWAAQSRPAQLLSCDADLSRTRESHRSIDCWCSCCCTRSKRLKAASSFRTRLISRRSSTILDGSCSTVASLQSSNQRSRFSMSMIPPPP